MATDRKIVKLVEALKSNKNNQNILIGKVNSINPFTLKMYDLIITQHIYLNNSFVKSSASAIDAEISWDRNQDYIPSNMLGTTRSLFKSDLINAGDTVIVLQDGISFYVLERVVKVA